MIPGIVQRIKKSESAAKWVGNNVLHLFAFVKDIII